MASDKLQFPTASLHQSELDSFCQIQVEQLTSLLPICWSKIVFYDFLEKTHKQVNSYDDKFSQLSQEDVIYLNSERWLTEFPHVFSVTEINFTNLKKIGYICPFGYREQTPEYILVLCREALSKNLQQNLQHSAVLLSKYWDLYQEFGRQKTEIQLFEDILQSVGHQLRTPLSLIGLCAENLSWGLAANPWQDQVTIIRETIQDLDTNLTELLYCGQSDKLSVSLQDLRTLLIESIQNNQHWINQKQLQVFYPESSTFLKIKGRQMKLVFENLLSNAIHFSPHSGTITCKWQIFQNEVLIEISDQGPGLSVDDRQHIFTPFYSRRPGGTGLGLTIAKKIVLDHQGSIWVRNLLEGGAQFCISLPRT